MNVWKVTTALGSTYYLNELGALAHAIRHDSLCPIVTAVPCAEYAAYETALRAMETAIFGKPFPLSAYRQLLCDACGIISEK